jgi:iron complex outermembrane receptor protein
MKTWKISGGLTAIMLFFVLQCADIKAETSQTEELLFMNIPMVVTASKTSESINEAPAVVYVITQKEIEISGAKSLADILKRVPGMRVSMRESSVLGSRGFTSDQNDKFLFLIDGAPIQNIMQDGSYNFIDMPNLNMVERIEVVKGPGSTLWGSDATFGIINIITKNGKDIAGTKASVDYSTGNDQFVGNLMMGNALSNGDYMASFSYTQSNGSAYGVGADKGNNIYQWGQHGDVLASGTVSPQATGDDLARMLDLSPSFEFYTKMNIDDFSVKARASYMAQRYLWNTLYGYKYTDADMKSFYIEAERVKKFGDNISWSTKINSHGMLYERGIPMAYAAGVSGVAADIETMTEMGFFLESSLDMTLAEVHHIIAGIKYTRINIGPDLRTEYLPSGANTENLGYLYTITLKPAIDDTDGMYLEDNYLVTDKLKLVGGLSYEYNDLREVGGDWMPRASVIYSFTDDMSLKYAYNTGYGRPPAMKKFGEYFGHAEESEKIQEHDVEFLINNKRFHFSATGFNYNIDDYFTWYDDGYVDPVTLVHTHAGDYNKGEAVSTGVELDARGYIGGAVSIYGNWTYAHTSINHALAVGEPKQVYNAGADWYITNDISANLNVNGFVDMYHGKDSDGEDMYWSGLTEQILDLSVVAKNLFDRYTVTIYANNLINNKVHVGMTSYPGYTYEPGFSIGFKISAVY